MTETWMLAAIWLGLALIAALFSVWLRIATALSEIVVGTLAQFILGIAFGASVLQADLPWIKFLAGGAIMLTFLAGAELDPAVLRVRWKEATAVGLMSFLAPFIGLPSLPTRCSIGTSPRAGLPVWPSRPPRWPWSMP